MYSEGGLSAFGIDHGYEEVGKFVNPMEAMKGARGAVKAATAGAHRAPGLSSVSKPVGALRTFTGGVGANISGGLKRAGAAVTGNPGKRAAPTLRTKVGGGLTSLGQKSFAQPYKTGAIGLGAAGAGAGAVGAGGAAAFGGRRKRPGQV
jgi:hypothetical protein